MKNTLVLLLIGLLITSNIVLGALYMLERSSDTGVASVESSDVDGEVAGETDIFMQETAKKLALEQVDTTRFDANVGKFSINIDQQYRIAVELDGGTDGLESTKVKVGRDKSDQPGVVSVAANDYVIVGAYPSAINGTRDEFVTADTALQGNTSTESSAVIDGAPARKFDLTGVGKTTKYYFERAGITYHIEAWDVSSGDTNVMLSDVVDGFSFN